MLPAGPLAQETIPGCIAGQIRVGGAQGAGGTIPALCQPYSVDVQICDGTIPPCTIPPCSVSAVADANGQFTVCDLAPGTYTLVVRGLNTLANRRTGITVPEGSGTIPGTVPVDFGTLTPGDANGNNTVEIVDYSILATAYGKASGGPGWDRRADFNCNGSIEILDYSLLATYYANSGATCP